MMYRMLLYVLITAVLKLFCCSADGECTMMYHYIHTLDITTASLVMKTNHMTSLDQLGPF